MPNAKVLSEKQAIVAALTEKLQNAAAGLIVDYKGITVAEDTVTGYQQQLQEIRIHRQLEIALNENERRQEVFANAHTKIYHKRHYRRHREVLHRVIGREQHEIEFLFQKT